MADELVIKREFVPKLTFRCDRDGDVNVEIEEDYDEGDTFFIDLTGDEREALHALTRGGDNAHQKSSSVQLGEQNP